jgi:hypothetical protein
VSTDGEDRDELEEDWFDEVGGEPGRAFRDPDAETWLEEPAAPGPPRDRGQLIAALAAAVALIVIGVGIARVVGDGDDAAPGTTAGTTAQTEPATTGETETSATTEPAGTVPDDVTLQRGDDGDEVMQLQEALVALGYDVGEPDGSFGPATEEAVKKFQADAGLEADGIAGPATLSAVNEALASNA